MQAFSVPATIELVSRHGYQRLREATPQDASGGLDPSRIVLSIHDLEDLARKALRAQHPDALDALRLYEEAELSVWPGWPTRLGRLTRDATGALTVSDETSPLTAQLAALRSRHAKKRHFRVALVGGFGFNFGDMMLGATAWRSVWPVLLAALTSVGTDVLLGPSAHWTAARLIGYEDGIDDVSFMPPSLADFARYDAFFDFSSLVRLPRFHEMAAVDWILWWLGLDPDAFGASAKRNRLKLSHTELDWARERLAESAAPRIAFVWRASTPLRSMPDEIARRFAADLLEAAVDITLVTDAVLGLDHPRVLDLGGEADSAERMMALVSQADGLIAIDSLAPHVADAADLPCVMLLASLHPSRFPFYPNMRIVTPPGMQTLPGWGVTKVTTEKWAEMKGDYADAWTRVSAGECWALLAERIAARAAPEYRLRVTYGEAWRRQRSALPQAGAPFPHDRMGGHERWIAREIERFAAQVLAPGRTALLVGGSDGTLALSLAKLVAPGGALHVLEPRRLRAQKLGADAQTLGLTTLHLIDAMANDVVDRRPIADFDPASESDPCAWGNLHRRVDVDTMTLDELRIDICRLLVVFAPQSALSALAGAAAFLRRTQTFIVAGPVPTADFDGVRDLLTGVDYRGSVSWPNRAQFDGAFLLATPSEADVKLEGFEPL